MALKIIKKENSVFGCGIIEFKAVATKGGYRGMNIGFILNYSPTGNCQIMSLRTFTNLQYFSDKEIVEIFECMAKATAKKCIMVDIKEIMYPLFKRIFSIKNDTILNAKFVSTNGSHMRHIVFKLDKFRN